MAEVERKSGFEKELANLERVVNLLERGDLPLEAAIQEYEQGYQSLKRCQEILVGAQKKIELLCCPPPTPDGAGRENAAARDGSPAWRPLDEGSLPTAQHPSEGPQPL